MVNVSSTVLSDAIPNTMTLIYHVLSISDSNTFVERVFFFQFLKYELKGLVEEEGPIPRKSMKNEFCI